MKKWVLILGFVFGILACSDIQAYCTPDNDTCFECGTNCIAELTFGNVVQKDGTIKNVGTFTVYGTGENGIGEMKAYKNTEGEAGVDTGARQTKAPWANRISEINNIVVKDGISNIGQSAFTGAKNLDHIELPESVSRIEQDAFMDSKLKSVNTLQNVTTFGRRAFERTSLSEIDLSDRLTEIPYFCFGLTSKLKNIMIPDSVTSIDDSAFFKYQYYQQKIYCNDTPKGRCDELFSAHETGAESGNIVKYERVGDGYYLEGKWYANPNNILTGKNIKKRIYTLEEANFVAGKTNTFSIRYR